MEFEFHCDLAVEMSRGELPVAFSGVVLLNTEEEVN